MSQNRTIEAIQTELAEANKKKNRLRKPESIVENEKLILSLEKELSSLNAGEKVSSLSKLKTLDVFRTIELYTLQVGSGHSNSLIVTGDPGVGKTKIVTDTLKSIGHSPNSQFILIKGTSSSAAMYETLFKHRTKTVVFDDTDAVLKDSECVNMLKAALDTYPVRTISKLAKGFMYYDPEMEGVSDTEMDIRFQDNGKLPTSFNFTGQIIFISNLQDDKFDTALISRSLHTNVKLTQDQLLERMKNIIVELSPEVDIQTKLETLDYVANIVINYKTKIGLNIRTLIHSINTRVAQGEKTTIVDGEKIENWKLLINNYLV